MAQYIVDFKNTIDQTAINDFLAANNASIVKNYSFFTKTFLLESLATPIDSNAITEYIIENDTTTITPLLTSRVIISDHTYGTVKTNAATISVDQEIENDWWKIVCIRDFDYDNPKLTFYRSGANTIVYVLDSGVNISHPEFINSEIENLFTFNNDYSDNHGHGTAIASVINGQNCGVSNCTVKSVKIFDSNTGTKQSDIINALESIYLDSIENPNKNKIVNCSWTIAKNEYIESKLRFLMQRDIFIVCSAGNSGQVIDNVTPASMTDVITIGSFNDNLLPSDFSNYSTPNAIFTDSNEINYGKLDGWAPGEKIYAATIDNGYALTAGTSIAAGIHSAVLAYNLGILNDYPLHILDKDYLGFGSAHSLSLHNLLDLNDPKYASSKNSISSMWFEYPWPSRLKIEFQCVTRSGRNWRHYICPSNKVKQVEIIGDLPEGMEIYPNMRIYGEVPEVTELYIKTVQLKVTGLDDFIYESELTFAILPPGWDWEKQSTGDPNIDYRLLACTPCNGGCDGPPDWCCGREGDGCWTYCDSSAWDKDCGWQLGRCICT
jgi:hypothetical protein